MNDKEFESFKFLELKYKRDDEVILPFCRISSLQEIRFSRFTLKKFLKSQRGTVESYEMD